MMIANEEYEENIIQKLTTMLGYKTYENENLHLLIKQLLAEIESLKSLVISDDVFEFPIHDN